MQFIRKNVVKNDSLKDEKETGKKDCSEKPSDKKTGSEKGNPKGIRF
jgi:hypothetical protein